MKMLEKIEAVKKAQGWRADVEKKLKEVIESTYDYHCTGIEDFTIRGNRVAVTYEYVCRGYGDVDYVDIPVEWLAEDFDYKAAFEEERRKTEERRRLEALEEQKKAEAKKEKEEKKLYLRLKAKYEKEGLTRKENGK